MRSFQPPTLELRGGGGGGGNVGAAAWKQRRGMCVWGWSTGRVGVERGEGRERGKIFWPKAAAAWEGEVWC